MTLFTTYADVRRQPAMPIRQPKGYIPDSIVKRVFRQSRITLHDGPIPVTGKVLGWNKTNAGPLGAVIGNPITGRRFLYCLDFRTLQPRELTRLT